MFEGVMTALVTPFKNGQVDESGLRGLVEDQIAGLEPLAAVLAFAPGAVEDVLTGEAHFVSRQAVHTTRERCESHPGLGQREYSLL